MSNKIIDESTLSDIGDAIRQKRNVTAEYKPSQMPAAIRGIESFPEPTGTITIKHNGIVGVKNYASATVEVEPEFDDSDEGKVVSNGALVAQTSTTKTSNGTYDTTTNDEVVINVPNSYSVSDEGKVVDDGALVAQGSQTITENGTYDTTLISELIANISGGGGGVQKDFLYEFNESQGARWIDTEVSVADIETLCFDDVRSDDLQKSTIIDVADIAVYTGGADVYTLIYTQTKPMNARIYNGNLWVSYNGTGAATNVTKIYSYIESGGGGAKNILSGTDAPTASLGNDGDVYIQYLSAGVKNSYNQCINTGYSANTNSKLVCDFLVTEAQTSEYPTIFGARPNAGNTTSAISWHMAKQQRDYSGAIATWQNQVIINGVGATALLGKVARVELENGLFKLTADGINVEQALTQVSIASSTPIFLFQIGINGSASSFGQTKGIIIFNFKIYENDVLIHDFVPAKDTNDVVCLYDEVAQEYKYANTGTLEYIEEGTIQATYCKVNGAWQNLIGTDIDDVNTQGDTPVSDDWTTLKNYIQSSGTQYIDTGYIANDNTKVELIANVNTVLSQYAALFGARNGTYNTATKTFIAYRESAYMTCYVGGGATKGSIAMSQYLGSKSKWVLSKESFGAENSDEINFTGIGINGGTVDNENNMYLLSFNENGVDLGTSVRCSAKVYRFRIYEGDTLVHEFIPWQDNGVACLKDTVTGNIKYNAGTGDFTYGTDA